MSARSQTLRVLPILPLLALYAACVCLGSVLPKIPGKANPTSQNKMPVTDRADFAVYDVVLKDLHEMFKTDWQWGVSHHEKVCLLNTTSADYDIARLDQTLRESRHPLLPDIENAFLDRNRQNFSLRKYKPGWGVSLISPEALEALYARNQPLSSEQFERRTSRGEKITFAFHPILAFGFSLPAYSTDRKTALLLVRIHDAGKHGGGEAFYGLQRFKGSKRLFFWKIVWKHIAFFV